jgi:transcriptional regulator NrdR family protein
MKLFGWMKKRNDPVPNFYDNEDLARDLERQAAKSEATQQRIDSIVDIEKVRLRNLELRAEVLSRTRGE